MVCRAESFGSVYIETSVFAALTLSFFYDFLMDIWKLDVYALFARYLVSFSESPEWDGLGCIHLDTETWGSVDFGAGSGYYARQNLECSEQSGCTDWDTQMWEHDWAGLNQVCNDSGVGSGYYAR